MNQNNEDTNLRADLSSGSLDDDLQAEKTQQNSAKRNDERSPE